MLGEVLMKENELLTNVKRREENMNRVEDNQQLQISYKKL